jgi:hypothetical protein
MAGAPAESVLGRPGYDGTLENNDVHCWASVKPGSSRHGYQGIKGAMNGEAFLAYIEQCLVPTLKRRDVVVIDDVPFHKVSVRHALTKKSTIAVLHQPFRTCEMTLPGAACSGRLAYRVDAENQKSCLVPLGTVAFGIEETTIGDKMFFVIVSQCIGAGRLIGEHRAKVLFAHRSSAIRRLLI